MTNYRVIILTILTNFLTNIIDTYLLYFYLKVSFGGVKTSKKNNLIGLFILIALNTLVNSVLGLANFGGFILILILSSLTFSLFFKEKFLNIIIMLLIGVVIMFALELITANLVIYFFKLPPSSILELNVYRLLAIIISKGSFFLIVKYRIWKMPFISYIHSKKSLPLAFIFLFNAIIIYMAFILYKFIEISSNKDYIIFFTLTLCAILFNWLIYVFTKRMLKQEQQEELMKLKIKEYENQKFYIKNMEDIMVNIRAQKHDFINHVTTLYGLIYLNKLEEAKKYILDLAEDISFVNKIIDTGHPVITALINMKRDRILREKIMLNLDVQLPEKISFDYIDLSIIIGNLLDNAIEACLNPSVKESFIDLKILTKVNYLVIEISNTKSNTVSIAPDSLGHRFTTKEDKESHGFGLSNIKRIVEQYGGILKLEDKENIFDVYIALPLE